MTQGAYVCHNLCRSFLQIFAKAVFKYFHQRDTRETTTEKNFIMLEQGRKQK